MAFDMEVIPPLCLPPPLWSLVKGNKNARNKLYQFDIIGVIVERFSCQRIKINFDRFCFGAHICPANHVPITSRSQQPLWHSLVYAGVQPGSPKEGFLSLRLPSFLLQYTCPSTISQQEGVSTRIPLSRI